MKTDPLAVFADLRKGRPLPGDTTGLWSYPALVVMRDKTLCWLCLVLPIVEMRAKKRTALFRPRAAVTTKAQSRLLVHYSDFRTAHDPFLALPWDKPVAMYPHKSIAQMTYRELADAEKQLLTSYGSAGSAFVATGSLPEPFREQYLRLTHPIFLSYLKHLAPAFVRALATPVLPDLAAAKGVTHA
ncbi:MAG: hypothetical protein K8T26_19850 [Lentisphaerae bacterium]|nr:hypothetical protein [Lentisphaerota bacterium]